MTEASDAKTLAAGLVELRCFMCEGEAKPCDTCQYSLMEELGQAQQILHRGRQKKGAVKPLTEGPKVKGGRNGPTSIPTRPPAPPSSK